MTEGFKIGPYQISKGAMLSPMAGVTNPPFRRLCVELGASLSPTELISSHALVLIRQKPAREKKKIGMAVLPLIEPFENEFPLMVQLFGREPEIMAEAAREAEARGAHIVDLNFGCPAKKVIKNGEGAGAALMKNPELLQQIASECVKAVKVPVTAKMRLGWSPDEKNAVEIAKRLEDAGVQMLCVHARTRDQIHWGETDLQTLAQVCEAVSIPVIGNGGIKNIEDAVKMKEETKCAAVAVGQAAKGNPWIFRELLGNNSQVTLQDRIATCRRHLEFYLAWGGELRAVREMRKHVAWYLKGFEGAAAYRKRINETNSFNEFMIILDELKVSASLKSFET